MPSHAPLVPLGNSVPAIIVIGTDTLLAALPATPAQLVQACLAAGFGAAVPAAWGDELVATGALRKLATHSEEAAILCACPNVVRRLLQTGADIERFLVPLVAPPVAAARYIRALYGAAPVRITYAGDCSSGRDPVIDERLLPHELLAALAARGIDPAAQPTDIPLPPGHRRFRSLPGGAPAPEPLFAEGGGRTLVELEAGDDYAEELAQRLMAHERSLFDLGARFGCACSGAVPECPPERARAAVAAVEGARARDEVLDPSIRIDVAGTLPRFTARPAGSRPLDGRGGPRVASLESSDGSNRAAHARRRFRTSGIMRAVTGHPPVARIGEGRTLPRAYAAFRQRLTTGSGWAATPRSSEVVVPASVTTEREVPRDATRGDARARRHNSQTSLVVPLPQHQPYRVPLPPPDFATRVRFALGVALLILAAVLLVW
ncbi:MAG: hypothetical protein M3373_14715 [Gemmatimonadota bacterium]|nr:hypothetical protein [Gemmatimonadota bacterium]